MEARRTVFGFELDSPFPLQTARFGTGSALRIVSTRKLSPGVGAPLLSWTADANNPLDATLRDDGAGGFVLEIGDAGNYQVRPDEGIIRIPPSTPDPLREIRLMGLPLLLCFLKRGDLSLHAAAVEGPNGAILIAAPGRHGKTSLAAAFMKLGCRLLTEDLCCISPGPIPMILPGPASLRVRPDMAQFVLPIPSMVEIGTLDERLVLTSDNPGNCDPVPVGAILLLKDFGDHLSVEPSPALDRLPDLWLLSLHLPSEADRTRKFGQLVDLLNTVPAWDVIQSDDRSELERSAESILATLR